jgi:hypothetical protein
MKNVAVTMEDSVAGWARMEAARCNTRASRLVGEMLAEKMHHHDACEGAMREALRFEPLPFTGPYAHLSAVDVGRDPGRPRPGTARPPSVQLLGCLDGGPASHREPLYRRARTA